MSRWTTSDLEGKSDVHWHCPKQSNRTRESSVPIDPSWQMLEEIDFLRMAKLRLEPEEPTDL